MEHRFNPLLRIGPISIFCIGLLFRFYSGINLSYVDFFVALIVTYISVFTLTYKVITDDWGIYFFAPALPLSNDKVAWRDVVRIVHETKHKRWLEYFSKKRNRIIVLNVSNFNQTLTSRIEQEISKPATRDDMKGANYE